MAYAFPAPPPPAPDPLEDILALCLRAEPTPESGEAAQLSRLLDAAGRAGGDRAKLRIDATLAGAPWRVQSAESQAVSLFADHADRAGDERRLAAKLAAAGALHPGLLLSALDRGRAPLFHAVLAGLCGQNAETLEPEVAASPERLALALRAAGVDRSVFGPVRRRLEALAAEHDPAALTPKTAQAVDAALRLVPAEACARLAQALGA